MKNVWNKFMTKLLWALKPVVLFINDHFSIPDIIKKVNGHEFYTWQPKLTRGMVFLTETAGEGSNLINPSPDKHGAMYFGQGLRSALDVLHTSLLATNPNAAARIATFLQDSFIQDDVPFIIEAVKAGVIATDLATFMLEKDRAKVMTFSRKSFSPDQIKDLMSKAASATLVDLGLPYDYGFTNGDDARYCFELAALGYKRVIPDIDLPQVDTIGHLTFQASSFLSSTDFSMVLNSETN